VGQQSAHHFPCFRGASGRSTILCLPAVELTEGGGGAVAQWRTGAQSMSPLGRLDLDHPRRPRSAISLVQIRPRRWVVVKSSYSHAVQRTCGPWFVISPDCLGRVSKPPSPPGLIRAIRRATVLARLNHGRSNQDWGAGQTKMGQAKPKTALEVCWFHVFGTVVS